MAQVVMAGDQKALPGKPLSERIIPAHVLHHAVGDLEDGPGLALREPADGMDPTAGGVGIKIKVFGSCHGYTFL